MNLINSKTKQKPYALVGGMGCGKSTASILFEKAGFDIVNADKILHSVYESSHPKFLTLAKLLDMFLGTDFVHNEQISRPVLRERVGSDKSKLEKMITITRPFVLVEIKEICKKIENPMVEFPLLFEMDLRHHFSDVICVSCSQETQIKRIKQRNHTIQDHEILSMLQVQKSNHYKESHSSFIINNDENDENYTVLKDEVQKISSFLKKRVSISTFKS